MNQALQSFENTQNQHTLLFHEGQHNILDGVEDMDDIFGVHEEETNRKNDEDETKIKKRKTPKK